MTKLAAILDQIDSGSVLLPGFQRGYVWNRDQVRGLMRSLYLGYPVGSLLTWETEAGGALAGGAVTAAPAPRVLILDGQQRITSLYGVVRGRPPAFFHGDDRAFTGLRFHLEREAFDFRGPATTGDDPRWVDVTSLYRRGLEPHVAALNADPASRPLIGRYLERLTRLRQVLDRDLHQEKITGADKSVDVVIEIFNLVNSGGTKLSEGDLALARKCTQWPQARAVVRAHLERWEREGFSFTQDWLLRNAAAVAAGRTGLGSLDAISAADFRRALDESAVYVSRFLDLVAGHLGLDHNRVLTGRCAIPVICRLLHLAGGHFADSAQADRILYWYINAAFWGRYAGADGAALDRDCETAARTGTGGLIGELERWRGGNLLIDGDDLTGSGRGARCYPLLYLLTAVHGGRDFGTGLPARAERPDQPAGVQVHHIFPRALLRAAGYTGAEVNAVANLCFLTRETSLLVARRGPAEYCGAVEATHPGALASQWIPRDPALWRVDRYLEFLAARRELLAAAANEFLGRLRTGGGTGDGTGPARARERPAVVAAAAEEADPGAGGLEPLIAELARGGCADPAVGCEVSDPATGEVLVIAQACWPEGLLPGAGKPVILVLDPAEATLARLVELGYEAFTSADSLRSHVRDRNGGAWAPAGDPAPKGEDTVPPFAAMRM